MNISKKKWMVYGGIAMAIIVTAFAAPAMAADAETSWIDEQRAMETKRMVREVLADSQFRTSLSGDTSPVTVDLGGFAITRWNYNNGGGSVQNNEFSIPYARLEVSGRIMDKVDYVVSGEFSDYTTGSFELVDAYLTMGLGGDFDLRVGQFVTSFYNGYTDSPLDQVAGEYSILATTFGQGRSQGLEVSRDFGFLDLSASYNDGFNSNNSFVGNDDYGVSVRAGLDFGHGFHAGVAYAYQSEVEDYGTYTADLGYTNGNWDLGFSYVAADYVTGGFSDNYGINAIVAYQCMENLQGFVQYQNGKLGVASSDLNIIEVGANYDIATGVRWNTTFGYAFDSVDAGWDLGRSGWSSGDSDGQYLLRTQISVSF